MAGKFPALLLTVLPLLILIPSFILSAYSSANKDWTWRYQYDSNTQGLLGSVHRGPFVSCQLPALANATDECIHTNKPGGLCNGGGRSRADNEHFCRQLALGGRLLYSGNALLAAALLVVLVLTAGTAPQVLKSGGYVPKLFGKGYKAVPTTETIADIEAYGRHSHHHHEHGHATTGPAPLRQSNLSLMAFLSLFLRLFAGLSAVLLLIGTIITTNVLVNLQYPMGDWYTTGNAENFDIIIQNAAGPWLIGKAVGMCVAGAVLAAIGAWISGFVWSGPAIGVGSVAAKSHRTPVTRSADKTEAEVV